MPKKGPGETLRTVQKTGRMGGKIILGGQGPLQLADNLAKTREAPGVENTNRRTEVEDAI